MAGRIVGDAGGRTLGSRHLRLRREEQRGLCEDDLLRSASDAERELAAVPAGEAVEHIRSLHLSVRLLGGSGEPLDRWTGRPQRLHVLWQWLVVPALGDRYVRAVRKRLPYEHDQGNHARRHG